MLFLIKSLGNSRAIIKYRILKPKLKKNINIIKETASLSYLGNIIAISNLPVDSITNKDAIETKLANSPKKSGVYNLDIIGNIKKDKNCANTDHDIRTITSFKNELSKKPFIRVLIILIKKKLIKNIFSKPEIFFILCSKTLIKPSHSLIYTAFKIKYQILFRM